MSTNHCSAGEPLVTTYGAITTPRVIANRLVWPHASESIVCDDATRAEAIRQAVERCNPLPDTIWITAQHCGTVVRLTAEPIE